MAGDINKMASSHEVCLVDADKFVSTSHTKLSFYRRTCTLEYCDPCALLLQLPAVIQDRATQKFYSRALQDSDLSKGITPSQIVIGRYNRT